MERRRTARDSAGQELFARLDELYEAGEYEKAETRRCTPYRARKDSGRLDLVTAEALHGPGRRGEAEAAARRALTDCEHRLHPAQPRIREVRVLPARVTGEEPRP
ncbi:hypothetical protein [Streptomyces viridosporus]|uniref:hypothetical protein n=1 Tax=Streptomyces viridosporus TaxID=67581 RepID=UPI0009BE8A51|nr:hypothetical protein [Streptomyces viridosporus]